MAIAVQWHSFLNVDCDICSLDLGAREEVEVSFFENKFCHTIAIYSLQIASSVV